MVIVTCGAGTATNTLSKDISIGKLYRNYTANLMSNSVMYQYIVDSDEETPENLYEEYKKEADVSLQKKINYSHKKALHWL